MIRRSTWLILILFLAVLAGGLYFQKYQSDKQAQVTPTTQYKLFFADLEKSQVVGVEINGSQGQSLSLVLDQTGSWIVEGSSASDTDQNAVDDLLTKLTALTVMSDLEIAPALDVIGLTQPVYTLRIKLKDGGQKSALIGKLTPTGSGYYAQLDNGNPVVVGKYALDNLVNYLQKPPLATPVPTATEVITGESTQTPQP